MPDPADRAAFYKALLEAQRQAEDVPATRTHYDGYPFASNQDVARSLVPILQEHELVVELAAVEDYDDIEQETKGGKVQYMTTIRGTWRVTHTPTGFSMEYPLLGRRTNDKDKGILHAVSSMRKQFLLLLLGVEEDREDDGGPPPGDVERGRPARQGRQQQPPPPSGSEEQPRRIKEARGIPFKKNGSSGWVRNDTGEALQTCPKCAGPMLEIPPGRERWLCVDSKCETYLDVQEERQKETDRQAQQLEERRETMKSLWEKHLRKNHVETWQVEAFVRLAPELRDDPEKWGPEEFEYALETVRKKPTVLQAAAKKLAEEEPIAADFEQEIRDLLDDLDAGMTLRARANEAINSGWHDAAATIHHELLELAHEKAPADA